MPKVSQMAIQDDPKAEEEVKNPDTAVDVTEPKSEDEDEFHEASESVRKITTYCK